MTTATGIVSVQRASTDTPCRRCHRSIRPGQRIVLVLGTGTIHLRCLIGLQAVDTKQGR